MNRNCRYTVPLALLGWLVAASGALGADAACKAARGHFRDGIWWFETRDWSRAAEHTTKAIQALAEARDCEPDELKFIVLYGRWRYEFSPEIYLGAALAKAELCEPEREWSERLAAGRIRVVRRPADELELVRPLEGHDHLLLPGECSELWSAVTLLRGAIRRQANTNRLSCEQMTGRLARIQ